MTEHTCVEREKASELGRLSTQLIRRVIVTTIEKMIQYIGL